MPQADLDTRLLNADEEMLAARELNASRKGKGEEAGAAGPEQDNYLNAIRRNVDFDRIMKDWVTPFYDENLEAFGETFESFEKVEKSESRLEALKQGLKLGLYLKKRIKDGKFDSFIVVLILSLIKDFIDFASLGTFGTVFNIFITITLFIVFFLQKQTFKKYFIKKFLWKYIAVMVAEYIPGLDVMPSYTMSAILLKLSIDRKIGKMKKSLDEVEKVTERLKHKSNYERVFKKNKAK